MSKQIDFTRREFLAALGGGAVGIALATLIPRAFRDSGDDSIDDEIYARWKIYPEKLIGKLSELQNDTPVDFDYPNEGQTNVLVKLGEQARGGIGQDRDIVAFSDVCTHMGCRLDDAYDATHKVIGPCVCHFTTFDIKKHGYVTIGQATQSLPQITLRIDGDNIYATGVLGLIYGEADNLIIFE